jgi:hypothetical protein
MKNLVNVIAFIGFYLIGGVMFLYQGWQLFWGIVFHGKNFNEPREEYYGKGVSDDFEPIDLDMMKWWFLIGIASGIYLYSTGQLTWLTNWINKRKNKE